jgi:hypothetical protein
LNNKLDSRVAGLGTHGLQLERGVVPGEHTTILVARVVHKATGFIRSEGNASAKSFRRNPGTHPRSSHLFVGSGRTATKARGLSTLDTNGEHAGDGSEHRGRLHFACWYVWARVLVIWDTGRFRNDVAGDDAKKIYESKQEASFIPSLDGDWAWSPSDEGFLRIMLGFLRRGLFSGSVLQVLVAFQSIVYARLASSIS